MEINMMAITALIMDTGMIMVTLILVDTMDMTNLAVMILGMEDSVICMDMDKTIMALTMVPPARVTLIRADPTDGKTLS